MYWGKEQYVNTYVSHGTACFSSFDMNVTCRSDQALLPRVIADFRQQQQIAYGGYQNPPISTSYRQTPGQHGGGQYAEYNSDGYVVPDRNYNDFGEQYEYNDEYGRPLSSSSRSYYKYTSLYDRMSR